MTHKTPEQLLAYLDHLGIEHETISHAPVFSVAESHHIKPRVKGAGCKCLFLKDGKEHRHWLLATLDEKRVHLNTLSKELGVGRFSFGAEEKMVEYLGVRPGAVTLFAAINDVQRHVEVIVDADILAHDWISFHPLHNTQTTSLRSADALTFLDRLSVRPLIVKVPAMPPAHPA